MPGGLDGGGMTSAPPPVAGGKKKKKSHQERPSRRVREVSLKVGLPQKQKRGRSEASCDPPIQKKGLTAKKEPASN